MTTQELLIIIAQHHEAYRDTATATAMSAYMRNLFPFLGINRPQRNEINKKLFALIKDHVNKQMLEEVASALYQKQEREYHYFALDLLAKYAHYLDQESLSAIKELAMQHAWWDSIDFIATKIVSKLIIKYPIFWEQIEEWSVADNLWLRRIAIICQIPLKKKTDEKRLFQYCLYNAQDKDFFIRKAIGWALREYSKTNPVGVIDFVAKNAMVFSNLTQKEALKRINSEQ